MLRLCLKYFWTVVWQNLRYCIVALSKEQTGIVNSYFYLISTDN